MRFCWQEEQFVTPADQSAGKASTKLRNFDLRTSFANSHLIFESDHSHVMNSTGLLWSALRVLILRKGVAEHKSSSLRLVLTILPCLVLAQVSNSLGSQGLSAKPMCCCTQRFSNWSCHCCWDGQRQQQCHKTIWDISIHFHTSRSHIVSVHRTRASKLELPKEWETIRIVW